MIFYFIYEILIKKYNIQIVKNIIDIGTDININKEYVLEEIVINNPKISKNRIWNLDPIIELSNKDEMYNLIEMIV